MPILDPSLQYSLADFKLEGSNTYQNFLLKYIKIASRNINRNYQTLHSSFKFKDNLKKKFESLNKRLSCTFISSDFNHSLINNAYHYLIRHISSKNSCNPTVNNYYTYSGDYNINFCIPFSDSQHTWFLTDSPVAILSYHPTPITLNCENINDQDELKEKIKEELKLETDLINFEIDLLLSSGFTLALCVLAKPDLLYTKIKNFLNNTVQSYHFAEIHFNLEIDSKSYDLQQYEFIFDAINSIYESNNSSFFYLYTHFTQYPVKKLSELKDKPFFKIFRFSQSLKKSLKHTTNSFIQIKPFAYCETGFDFDKLRVSLCNVPLYAKEDEEIDTILVEDSEITLGFIPIDDFFEWQGRRIPIIVNDKENKHSYIQLYIDFDDVHSIKPEFYVAKTLYLTKTDSETLKIIDDISNEVKSTSKVISKQNIVKKDPIQSELENVLDVFYEQVRTTKFNQKFSLHDSQIFTIFDACKKCINEDEFVKLVKSPSGRFRLLNLTEKDEEQTTSKKKPRVLYQVETGEGKSVIISLIAAVISRLVQGKTVHIVSSNIFLSKRDYEDSYDFFRKLNLKSSVLLHSNELPKDNTLKKYYSSDIYNKKQFKNSLKMNYDTLFLKKDKKIDIVFSTFVNFESFYLRMMEMSPEKVTNYFQECTLIVDEADAILIDELTNGTVLSCPVHSNVVQVLTFVYENYMPFKLKENEIMNEMKIELSQNQIDEIIKKIKKRNINTKGNKKKERKGKGNQNPKETQQQKEENENDKIEKAIEKEKDKMRRAKEKEANVRKAEFAQKILSQVKEKWPKCNDIQVDDILQMFAEIDVISQGEYYNGKKYAIKKCHIEKNNNLKKFQKLHDLLHKVNKYFDPTVDYGKQLEDTIDYLKVVPFDYKNKGVFEPNKEFPGFMQQFIAIKEMNENNYKKMIKIKNISLNYLYISHPIFVKMYERVCAFTGTVGDKNCLELLYEHYNIISVKISRNKPNRRIDLPIILCETKEERNLLIQKEIMLFSQRGNPVLVIFQDLNEINEMKDQLQEKGIYNIQIYNGSDENIRPDVKAGLIGAISLGTNYCGRGTNIENPIKPLHVIVSYFTTNKRVMDQALGRTARQGKQGTTRIICLKDEYIHKVEIFKQDSIKKVLNVFDVNNLYQNQYIELFRKTRKWIFDEEPGQIKHKQYESQLDTLRKVNINVNRFIACDVEFPICMSVETFLDIQSQKIFSLYNCPNSKYTWQLFQRYIREMILESWSLFINKAEKDYQKEENNKIDYELFIKSESLNLFCKVSQFIPEIRNHTNEICDIFPTFMHIFKYVVKKWQPSILKTYSLFAPDSLEDNAIKSKIRKLIYFGFKPYALVPIPGEDPDQINYLVKDPELVYYENINGKRVFLSLTRKIDGLFNLICQKISDVLTSIIGLKFFLRRTLGGCEFGICLDMDLEENEENDNIDPNCIVDRDPLLVLTISVKSVVPVLAGILIIVLIYVAKLIKNIMEWITQFPVKAPLEIFKQVVKTIVDEVLAQQIEAMAEKICDHLLVIFNKQVEKIKQFDPKSKYIKLFDILSKIIIPHDLGFAGDKISEILEGKFKIKNKSKFVQFAYSHLPLASLLKIGLIMIMCIGSFVVNFKYSKSLKHESVKAAKEYDENNMNNPDVESINLIIDKYSFTIPETKISGSMTLKQSFINGDQDFDSLAGVDPTISKLEIPSYIYKICEYAFLRNVNISDVKFASNSYLHIIDKCAFFASHIEKIIIPKSVVSIEMEAFFNSKLKSITFEKNSKLERIESKAFKNTLLESIEIPSKVDYIAQGIFSKVRSLNSISIPNNDTFADIDHKVIIKKSSKSLNDYDILFYACKNIERINIPAGIKEIVDKSFKRCYKLNSVNIDEYSTLKSIGELAFTETSIKKIVIPSSVTTIGKYAFSKCHNLYSVIFLDNSMIENLDEGVFSQSAIEKIVIPKKVMEIEKNAFLQCRQLKSVKFEDDSLLSEIKEGAFSETAITKIKIPSNTKVIQKCAFLKCSCLSSIIFKKNSQLTNIGTSAFGGTLIEEIKIPQNISDIRDDLFVTMDNLKSISLSKKSPYFFSDSNNKIIFKKKLENETSKTPENEANKTSENKANKTPESIKTHDKNVPNYLIYACRDITNAIVPKQVICICNSAFYGCINLNSIKFEEGSCLESFDNNSFTNSSIKSIEIPKYVTRIGDDSFLHCQNLKEVIFHPKSKLIIISKGAFSQTQITKIKIPSSTTHINNNAFAQCKQLKSIEFESNSELQFIGILAFNGTQIKSIIIPSNVTKISEQAFFECDNLTSISFEDDSKLKLIDKGAFKQTPINEISIPSSATEIGEAAFSDCLSLETINISEDSQLKTIHKEAFKRTPIESIFIPSSVDSIGESSFKECEKLKYAEIGEDSQLKYIQKEAFEGSSIKEFIFPKYVTKIGDAAFYHCKSLEHVGFAQISELGEDLSDREKDLCKNSIEIGEDAFRETLIPKITIPKGVTYIGSRALSDCKLLTEIKFEDPKNPPSFGSDFFKNSPIKKFH